MIAEQGNVEDLLQKIRQIKTTGKAIYTQACRTKAETTYSNHANFQTYIDLYRDLLAEATGHQATAGSSAPGAR